MAGPYYVRSTDGDDADGGTTWALAKATLVGAFAVAAAGDTIYVSQAHAETQALGMTLTSPGTAAAPCRVLCGNDAAEPPTALATTATIDVSSTGMINIEGYAYFYGVQISGIRSITLCNAANGYLCFDSCKFVQGGSVYGIVIGNAGLTPTGGVVVELVNTPIQYASASGFVLVCGQLLWRDTPSALQGTALTVLFTGAASRLHGGVRCQGLDLSLLAGSSSLVNAAVPHSMKVVLDNCKLGSGVSMTTGAIVGPGAVEVQLVNCDSADTNYRYYKQDYQGSIYSESTIVRTGGASDGTTPISRKMVSSANSQFFSPLESDPCVVWNETVGSSVTATVEIVTDNVTLTDAEAWIEVEYLGTSGFPLSLFADDRAADILATPANQTSSSVDWTTTGLGTPLKQKLSVAFTPQEKGPIKVRVMLAKASTTMYFCPKVDVT